jgi:hypothetical protein
MNMFNPLGFASSSVLEAENVGGCGCSCSCSGTVTVTVTVYFDLAMSVNLS